MRFISKRSYVTFLCEKITPAAFFSIGTFVAFKGRESPGESVLSLSLHCFIEKWRQREGKFFVTEEFSIENRATADET